MATGTSVSRGYTDRRVTSVDQQSPQRVDNSNSSSLESTKGQRRKR